jgi:hypothetical protein
MLSAAYRQASVTSPANVRSDPDNRWFGRMNARRLEAEAIRDSLLLAAGTLDRRPGGPAGPDLGAPRRSLYVQTVRMDRTNFSTLFDAADPEHSVEKRDSSTVAPQALFLLNHPFVRTQAERLARRLLEQVPGDEAARIDRAYQCLFARSPTGDELRIGLAYVQQARSQGTAAAWTDYVHLLLCSNEFVYVD